MGRFSAGQEISVSFILVVVGAIVGGLLWFSTGYFSLVNPIEGNVGSILWYLSMLGFFGGIGAPFMAMSYIRKYVDNSFAQAALTTFGYILIPATGVLVAYLGLVVGVGVENVVFLILAAFDLLFGVVLGAILGHKLSFRVLRERGLSEEWKRSARTGRF